MREESKNSSLLAAPCGLYYGACSIYQAVRRADTEFLTVAAIGITEMMGILAEAKDLQCDGCLSEVRSIQCRECLLRDCALSKGLTHCAKCNEFPCQQIIDFKNDQFAHHSEVIENIRRQQDIGIEGWIEEQQKRWRCPSCDNETEWYAVQCHHCGNALEGHF
ncbi:MAG: DUF3795 domain-containing protein [Chloroflexi bacterium]|nr:DUF3795 domain-containing protein [Chloroflexota bacterium]